METTENNQLTKDQGIVELLELLRKNDMKEAANSIFEMASYVDVMEKKMDSVLQELTTVKEQLHKMEEREAERGLKPALKRSAEKLEQNCMAVKEKLSEVKADIKAKAAEIVTAAKQKGKAALNRVSEFFGIKKKLENIRENVQESIAEVERSIGKVEAFGMGMREAGQKIANTFRAFADKPEKEYGEKKFSKTELMKKPLQAKRKLLCGILNCVDAAIEKTEKLARDVRQQRADRDRQGAGGMEIVSPAALAMVAEQEFQYGAEAFEAYQKANPLTEIGAETAKKPIQKSASR